MAIWNEDGLDERRANDLIAVALGNLDIAKMDNVDDEDLAFVEDCKRQIAEAEAKGIYINLSIPQM